MGVSVRMARFSRMGVLTVMARWNMLCECSWMTRSGRTGAFGVQARYLVMCELSTGARLVFMDVYTSMARCGAMGVFGVKAH